MKRKSPFILNPRSILLITVVLFTLLLDPLAALAQTNIAIPAASGGGVKYVLPERLGINLDSEGNSGNSQLMSNLLASDGTNFAPQVWNQSVWCAGSGATTTLWPDQNVYGAQPVNFWQGATYQVVSGADIGATGTITASTAANGSTVGQVYTMSPALSTGCSSNDMMILRCRTPFGTCAGGLTPYNYGSLFIYNTGSGAVSFETSDLSPSSTSPQALQLYAPVYSPDQFSNDNAGINPGFEGGLGADFEQQSAYLNINGTYTLTFRAKATAGAPVIRYEAFRYQGAVFLSGTATTTVNTTPGAGWTNYSFTFSADETGAQTEDGVIVRVLATGGTVLLQDVALTEAQTAPGNDTAFRDAVFLHLQALKPGTLRYMDGNIWGCTLDAMIASTPLSCGYSSFGRYGGVNAYSLNQFLYLSAKVGANPWFTMSPYSTPTDWADAAAYFNAPCSSGNSYATIRCNFLAGTAYAGETWTQVFNNNAPSGVGNIYLENGNEIWNSPNGSDLWANNGTDYGYLVGADNAALKASPYYSSEIHQVASGFVQQPSGPYSWENDVLTASCGITNGCPDYIDGAPYVFNWATDLTLPNLWTSMFTEPVDINTVTTGNVYQMQNFAQTFGVNSAIYETNLGTQVGISGVTQSQIDGIVAGIGAGLDSTLNMLLAARDAGVKVQNFFSLTGIGNAWYNASSVTAGSEPIDNSLYAPLWGANLDMSGPEASNTIDRPSEIMLQGINQAIGSKLNLLNTVQTGTPTYNQNAAQALPDYTFSFTGNLNSTNIVTSVSNFGGLVVGGVITGTGIPSGDTIASLNSGAGTLTLAAAATATATGVNLTSAFMSIAANSSVPYVQAFAFGDGAGNYSLIVDNVDSVSSHAITFSGAGAPTGTCTKSVFTSTNITDNNESVLLDGTPVVTYPSPTSYNCGSGGDTLPPFSMTTYTWTVASSSDTTPPSTPTGLTATSTASSTATLSWTASTDNVGVAGYNIDDCTGSSCTPNTFIGTSGSTAFTATGLTASTIYGFSVSAYDAAGNVSTSSASAYATTQSSSTVPAAPQSLSATPHNASVSLSWGAPSSNGGSSLTQYLVYDRFTGSSTFALYATTTGVTTVASVTSLTNAQSYDFEIVAQNVIGTSTPSSIVASTPANVPNAPTGVSATAGNSQATITFTAPGSNGGSTITSYTATSNTGNHSASSTASPISVGGLTNGQAYTFTVVATNAVGSSASSSASNSVTPTGLAPSIASFAALPLLVMPGASSTLLWTTTLASTVSINMGIGNESATSTGSAIVTPTSTTTYTITATNGSGSSTAQATVTVDGTAPSIPTSLQATTASQSEIDLSWTTSTDNIAVVGYGIYAGASTSSLTLIATTTNRTYANTGLAAGTTYYYAVTAFDAAGNISGQSSSTYATTQASSGGGGGGGGGGGSSGGGGGGGGSFVSTTTTSTSTTLAASSTNSTSTTALEALITSLEAQLKVLVQKTASQGSTSFTRNLSLGDHGTDVMALQEILIAAGELHITIPTPYFGSLTQGALAEYQQARGITPASGYFGPKTRAYLSGGSVPAAVATTSTPTVSVPSAPTTPAITTTTPTTQSSTVITPPTNSSSLSLGSRGSAVTTIQKALVNNSYLSPGIYTPGLFDAATLRAVETFQCFEGIVCSGPGYGVVGPKTMAALGE